MRRRLVAVTLVMVAVSGACALPGRSQTLRVGAVYPTGGGQGPGGLEELRGVQLAAAMHNEHARAGAPRVEIVLEPADSMDAASGAVRRLAEARTPVIVGSYGSTISKPAADEASRQGVVFWEAGAVGLLGMEALRGELVFRFPPTGETLGRAAVRFIDDEYAPAVGRGDDLRYTVTYVDDEYGRSVGLGALAEVTERDLTLAASLPYDLRTVDYEQLARDIADARTDVLVVSAYLEDAVAMRRALVARQVPLVAGIGTSSSYCHLEFGQRLGEDAVGLFASDKPDADVVRPDALRPDAAALLERARAEYSGLHDEPMTAAALSGFAAAWALFHHVLPAADQLTSAGIAAAARDADVPLGGLPNGSGLQFAAPDHPDAGSNLRATNVIWEWVRPATRAIVWPPAFATEPSAAMQLSS